MHYCPPCCSEVQSTMGVPSMYGYIKKIVMLYVYIYKNVIQTLVIPLIHMRVVLYKIRFH